MCYNFEKEVIMSNDDKWQDTRNSVNYVSKNIFAILGIVFAFLVAPVGLVLSIIGKNKAEQDGDQSSAKLSKLTTSKEFKISFNRFLVRSILSSTLEL